jgi:hypothetical protein
MPYGRSAAIAHIAVISVAVGLLAVVTTPASPPAKRSKVDVPVVITPPADAVSPGERGEIKFLLSPPAGIKINRYPPVRLKLEPPERIDLDAAEFRQGSDKPIADPKDFPFKTIEPLVVGFSVKPDARPGTTRVAGQIKFVYCVTSSGFCAPVTKDVGFDVTVAPRRAN